MKGPLVALPLALLASCALPVVSAGTFLPAGDLRRGDVHASVSMEVGRVLAGPTDVGDLGQRNPVPPETQQWEVLTWIASDLSIRWQALDRLALEAQLKLTAPVVPGYPVPVGGALGFRLRLLDLGPTREGLAIELGGRFVGVGVTEDLNRQTPDGRTQVDRWTYRALGALKFEQMAKAGKARSTRKRVSIKGVILSIVCGLLMGSFFPLVEMGKATELGLGPYAIGFVFSVGVFLSTFVFNLFFMNFFHRRLSSVSFISWPSGRIESK